KQQVSDGHWPLDGNYPDRGQPNDIAGTAFGLLPLLGAGYTQKASDANPFSLNVDRGLHYLMGKQDKMTGDLGGGMYAHALATMALCEAYGMTKSDHLRQPARLAVNHIIKAQHNQGGWRYLPGQAGDLSVTGFQVMAFVAARNAGLDMPQATLAKTLVFLDDVCATGTEGYCYIPSSGPTHTLTAVGLFCRQHLQSWGPRNARMISGVENYLDKNRPGAAKNMYYHYFASQVMRE